MAALMAERRFSASMSVVKEAARLAGPNAKGVVMHAAAVPEPKQNTNICEFVMSSLCWLQALTSTKVS